MLADYRRRLKSNALQYRKSRNIVSLSRAKTAEDPNHSKVSLDKR
jgi:hypothetical protein